MTLSDVCIRRPVFATVLSLIVVLLGLMAYDRLNVREYPNIDVPIVTVQVTYPGASPEIMESQVAQPVEDVLSGIEGLDFVTSISRAENTQITAQFRLGRSADEAANDVRDRLGRVRNLLPDEVDEPIVQKVEADPSRQPEEIARKLEAQLAALIDSSPSLDRDRLHAEAALLATKADLREEIDRLKAHVTAARDLLSMGGPIGRKLDFLAQEFNRESNTICSKSNAVAVTTAGIELKVVIDQFREQVQNLE